MGTPHLGISPREPDTDVDHATLPSDGPPATNAHSVPPDGLTTRKRKVSTLQVRVIDAMYETLGALDHYEILGVRRSADPLEIRCAYESLLLAFHPRRFEQVSLGPHGEKLDAIIRKIHEAFAALSKPDP
jgi:hypothetical protein